MSQQWAPAPTPPTPLGNYRLLSPLPGIHVSPICLGAMSIGDKWAGFGFGAMGRGGIMKVLNAYYERRGDFIDTANAYQDETLEEFIGDWMEQRGSETRW
ncbi:uncharacterized protein BXZ73DRAFT_102496 [Epithele typhae]|uniref:uncharacterized protein n=1 Tax=Epithele typhae TaxID=378194 RepID=UPI0020084F67|nr:uncharacterized protein BXZ73DRAFT_102496 [Epithele typhae]KAH9927988.1 hypothetical protein BXZ73DRAFT_102496 [Epithele typhae]